METKHNTNLEIERLIEKYEDKIKSIHGIIDRSGHWANRDTMTDSELKRLKVRIYERRN